MDKQIQVDFEYSQGEEKQADYQEVSVVSALDLSLKSIKTFIMTSRHRFTLTQVDDALFINWNHSSDPSGTEKHIQFNLCCVACMYFYVPVHFTV